MLDARLAEAMSVRVETESQVQALEAQLTELQSVTLVQCSVVCRLLQHTHADRQTDTYAQAQTHTPARASIHACLHVPDANFILTVHVPNV